MDKVCAVVVTYNRKDLLRRCLTALLNQTRKPDHVLVVNNASTDGTKEMLSEEFPQVELLNLTTNQGGAGGFHEGMQKAYKEGYDWIWLMDDDGAAARDCLQRLVAHSRLADVLVPVQIDSGGRRYGAGYWRGRYVGAQLEQAEGLTTVELFSFVGPLIHRRVVEAIGFPRRDFFIWADDLEYALRIRRVGLRCVAVLNANFYHDYGAKTIRVRRIWRRRTREWHPDWKYYYAARNHVLLLRSLTLGERLYSYLWLLYLLFRQTIGDAVYDPNWKTRTRYRWLGFLHGLMGVTGKTVEPTRVSCDSRSSRSSSAMVMGK